MYWTLTALVGGVWDAITEDIPDWLTIPGVVLAVIYGLFHPLELLSLLLFLGPGYLLYRYGVLGGGDILLIAASAPFLFMLFPYPLNIISPYLALILAYILSMAFYGMFFNVLQGRAYLLIPTPFLPFLWSLLYGIFLMLLVDKSLFEREVEVSELRKEDVLAEDIKGFNKRVIEEGDRERLKELGLKRVKILVNLPRMGPFIFLVFLILYIYATRPETIIHYLVRGLYPGS